MSKQLAPLEAIKQELNAPAMQKQIQAALPAAVPADRFLRTTMTVLSQNPDLVKCERDSLFSAIFSAASLGLYPESFIGQAYIIPYKGKAQLQVGYKGMIALARRSGDISSIESGVTYEKDEVEFIQGDESKFTIRPFLEGDPGKPKLVWCVITLKDGSKQREIMTYDQVEKIRKGAPSANSPAWKNSWDAMARKVVVKRALKYAPMSTEAQQALAMDDQAEVGNSAVLLEGGLTVVEDTTDEPKQPAKKKKLDQLKQDEQEPIEGELA